LLLICDHLFLRFEYCHHLVVEEFADLLQRKPLGLHAV
jgi:hypothetical protein